MLDDERRGDTRLRAEALRVEFPDLQARVRDLSLSGAYIDYPRPFPRGHLVRLRIWLTEESTIDIRAIVRRADEGVGMSVEFVEISQRDRTQLRRFLEGNT
ncbi:MAG: PilZ domain-containing protein [Acidobacteria bacterium]|nr:PilZ domain-containing protein [Acidobacteriota bacterium]